VIRSNLRASPSVGNKVFLPPPRVTGSIIRMSSSTNRAVSKDRTTDKLRRTAHVTAGPTRPDAITAARRASAGRVNPEGMRAEMRVVEDGAIEAVVFELCVREIRVRDPHEPKVDWVVYSGRPGCTEM